MGVPFDPRQTRLALERQRLEAVSRDSDYVKVEPVATLPGRAPENYKVTFLCRGIAAIDSSLNPIYTTRHEVHVYCHQDFPADVPWLHWDSPIWHPNIQHDGTKNVCVNKSEWLGGMGLDDLCQQMFEMVQYKNYHAELTPPYPLDSEAAAWVRDYAEPHGIVDKKRAIFVDNLPFYKPTATSERALRIKIHGLSSSPPPSSGPRIKIVGVGTKPSRGAEPRVILQAAGPSRCGTCGAELPSDSEFCQECGTKVTPVVRRIKIRN